MRGPAESPNLPLQLVCAFRVPVGRRTRPDGAAKREVAYIGSTPSACAQDLPCRRRVRVAAMVMLLRRAYLSFDPLNVRSVHDDHEESLREEMTCFVSSMRWVFARAVADRIVFMKKGRIIERGTAGQFPFIIRILARQLFLEQSSLRAIPISDGGTQDPLARKKKKKNREWRVSCEAKGMLTSAIPPRRNWREESSWS